MISLFLLVGCNLSYIVDLFAALHELASASARTLLKLVSSVRARLKPYWATLNFGAGNFRGRRPSTSALRMLLRLTAVKHAGGMELGMEHTLRIAWEWGAVGYCCWVVVVVINNITIIVVVIFFKRLSGYLEM